MNTPQLYEAIELYKKSYADLYEAYQQGLKKQSEYEQKIQAISIRMSNELNKESQLRLKIVNESKEKYDELASSHRMLTLENNKLCISSVSKISAIEKFEKSVNALELLKIQLCQKIDVLENDKKKLEQQVSTLSNPKRDEEIETLNERLEKATKTISIQALEIGDLNSALCIVEDVHKQNQERRKENDELKMKIASLSRWNGTLIVVFKAKFD